MRATLAIAVLFALAAPFCCLAAEQQPDLDKLIARADAAGEQKAELYARVVEAEVAAPNINLLRDKAMPALPR